MNPSLQFDRVTCRKGNTSILNGVTFSVNPGEILTVLGRSGSGKSTLLRLAIGLDEMSGGSILFQGRDIHEWNIAELRRRMGLVLQLPYLFMGSVEDNLLYGPRIHGLTVKDGDSMVSALLARVGLPGDLARRRTTDLSVGQQMRVSIGRTLANRPEILLLDEPTASLDTQSERHILDLIGQLNREGGYTVICVTHKIESARALGGRSLLLENGTVSLEGTVDEVLQRMDASAAQALLQGYAS